MKNIFQPGDIKMYSKEVLPDDVASFHGEVVHYVCSTFTLAREIEYASRLFVLEMKDDDEEGIGTQLEIKHLSPAFVGQQIDISVTIKSIQKNELICDYEVKVGDRLITTGITGQKILKKDRIKEIFSTFE